MTVVDFEPDHLRRLALQPAQVWMRETIDAPGYAQMLLADGQSHAVVQGDQVVAVCGVVPCWTGRACLLALLSAAAGGCMLRLHRAVSERIDLLPYRRLEATVDGDFEAGHNWLRLLGFRLETPHGMPGFLPDGRTGYLYARVK